MISKILRLVLASGLALSLASCDHDPCEHIKGDLRGSAKVRECAPRVTRIDGFLELSDIEADELTFPQLESVHGGIAGAPLQHQLAIVCSRRRGTLGQADDGGIGQLAAQTREDGGLRGLLER